MSWQVEDYQVVDRGAIAGRFTLQIGEMAIREWLHFKGDDGAEWVSSPAREYEADGERRYYSYCYIGNKDRFYKFQQWCLEQVKALAGATQEPAINEKDPEIPF